jgi:hypothetical protein
MKDEKLIINLNNEQSVQLTYMRGFGLDAVTGKGEGGVFTTDRDPDTFQFSDHPELENVFIPGRGWDFAIIAEFLFDQVDDEETSFTEDIDALVDAGMLERVDENRFRLTAMGTAYAEHLVASNPAAQQFLEQLRKADSKE